MSDCPFLLNPVLFSSIERLCRESLLVSGNSHSARSRVSELLVSFRVQAHNTFGHDSPEVMALVSLLDRTDPRNEGRPPARPDPVKELENQQLLSVTQVGAAWWIREIWMGWGRHLVVAGRNYEGSGGGTRSSAVSPVDTMSQRIWDMWLERYIPWVKVAKRKTFSTTNAADLVVRIVTEGHHIDGLAVAYGVEEERILKVLRRELDRFNDISSSTPKVA